MILYQPGYSFLSGTGTSG